MIADMAITPLDERSCIPSNSVFHKNNTHNDDKTYVKTAKLVVWFQVELPLGRFADDDMSNGIANTDTITGTK